MMLKSVAAFAYLILASAIPACAINLDYRPNLSDSQVQYYLNNPQDATAARYGMTDDAGNSMDGVSVIQLVNKAYRYAAVYHTGYAVGNGQLRFRVNLAVSNSLTDWSYQGVLIDNADMPKIAQVSGSDWIVVTHEQWQGSGPGSTSPSRVAFELFYSADDLLARTIRSTSLMPKWQSDLDGTPSIYEFHLAQYNGYYSADGQYGFHFWDGSRDVNGVTTILRMFDPTGGTSFNPSTAKAYNNLLIAQGVSGNIGQRDTLVTTDARYNIQEGNVGQPAGSFDKWRVWLYKFGDSNNYPTGNGAFTALAPQTPKGSASFGNPGVTILDSPSGSGKAIVISYFLFSEGAGSGEAGSLLYYFNL